MNRRIDFFLPLGDEQAINSLKEQLRGCPAVRSITPLKMENLPSTETVRSIAALAKADYSAIVTKSTSLLLGEGALERMARVADDSGAVLVYADRTGHPVIDYQGGSIRDDFDFGSLLLVRTSLLRQWAQEAADTHYLYGGLYDLRLFLSRHGQLLHLNETL